MQSGSVLIYLAVQKNFPKLKRLIHMAMSLDGIQDQNVSEDEMGEKTAICRHLWSAQRETIQNISQDI